MAVTAAVVLDRLGKNCHLSKVINGLFGSTGIRAAFLLQTGFCINRRHPRGERFGIEFSHGRRGGKDTACAGLALADAAIVRFTLRIYDAVVP